jgi:hypothetical protein
VASETSLASVDRAPLRNEAGTLSADRLPLRGFSAQPAPTSPATPALPPRSIQPDPGPPVAAGPGPQYEYVRAPTRSRSEPAAVPLAPAAVGRSAPEAVAPAVRPAADPGPSVAPGPGPRYDFSRLAQVPAVPGSDPGPPIAPGPGPLLGYPARAATAR